MRNLILLSLALLLSSGVQAGSDDKAAPSTGQASAPEGSAANKDKAKGAEKPRMRRVEDSWGPGTNKFPVFVVGPKKAAVNHD